MDPIFAGLEQSQKEILHKVENFKFICKKLFKLQEIIKSECRPLVELIPSLSSAGSFRNFLKEYMESADCLHLLAKTHYGALKVLSKTVNSTVDLLKLDQAECFRLLKQGITNRNALEKCVERAKATAKETKSNIETNLLGFLSSYSEKHMKSTVKRSSSTSKQMFSKEVSTVKHSFYKDLPPVHRSRMSLTSEVNTIINN